MPYLGPWSQRGFTAALCRFTKNLSPDKINLSTLKGEGQLSHLELDEEVLQNVLELPTWLAITRVYCNRASIRVRMGSERRLPSPAGVFSRERPSQAVCAFLFRSSGPS